MSVSLRIIATGSPLDFLSVSFRGLHFTDSYFTGREDVVVYAHGSSSDAQFHEASGLLQLQTLLACTSSQRSSILILGWLPQEELRHFDYMLRYLPYCQLPIVTLPSISAISHQSWTELCEQARMAQIEADLKEARYDLKSLTEQMTDHRLEKIREGRLWGSSRIELECVESGDALGRLRDVDRLTTWPRDLQQWLDRIILLLDKLGKGESCAKPISKIGYLARTYVDGANEIAYLANREPGRTDLPIQKRITELLGLMKELKDEMITQLIPEICFALSIGDARICT